MKHFSHHCYTNVQTTMQHKKTSRKVSGEAPRSSHTGSTEENLLSPTYSLFPWLAIHYCFALNPPFLIHKLTRKIFAFLLASRSSFQFPAKKEMSLATKSCRIEFITSLGALSALPWNSPLDHRYSHREFRAFDARNFEKNIFDARKFVKWPKNTRNF